MSSGIALIELPLLPIFSIELLFNYANRIRNKSSGFQQNLKYVCLSLVFFLFFFSSNKFSSAISTPSNDFLSLRSIERHQPPLADM